MKPMDEASRIAAMAREIGFAAWLEEQRQNFDEVEIDAERHATMRGENDHWSEIKAALLAYNKGRADMREEAGGWQDIATAPKNRTVVDLWQNGKRRIDAHYREGVGWITRGGWVANGPSEQPTHWRPRPDPPAIRAIPVGDE